MPLFCGAQMLPALYLQIDCDLYVSAYQALDWMLANKLVVAGTIIGYDDWTTGGEGGEAQAHHEVVLGKYRATVAPIETDPKNPARAFEVKCVGESCGSTSRR